MIDHERLREMEDDFGAEELAQIVGAFIDESSAAIEVLRTGWGDARVRRDRLHFIKGCARTMGAVGLGDLCERIETGAAGPGEFRALEREFLAAREALLAMGLRQAG